MGLLRWWLFLTAALLLGFLVWVFVPILVPVLLITAIFGALVPLIVTLARRLDRARHNPSEQADLSGIRTHRQPRRRSELPD